VLPYLTEVDHRDHEALVAVEPATGAGVGIARRRVVSRDGGTVEISRA